MITVSNINKNITMLLKTDCKKKKKKPQNYIQFVLMWTKHWQRCIWGIDLPPSTS